MLFTQYRWLILHYLFLQLRNILNRMYVRLSWVSDSFIFVLNLCYFENVHACEGQSFLASLDY